MIVNVLANNIQDANDAMETIEGFASTLVKAASKSIPKYYDSKKGASQNATKPN